MYAVSESAIIPPQVLDSHFPTIEMAPSTALADCPVRQEDPYVMYSAEGLILLHPTLHRDEATE
jgi:hypothetical protein